MKPILLVLALLVPPLAPMLSRAQPTCASPPPASAPKRPTPQNAQPQQVHEVTLHCGTNTAVQTTAEAVERKQAAPEPVRHWLFDLIDLLIRLLGVIAWPGALLSFLILFREELKELINRLESASWGGNGLRFARGVNDTAARAKIEPSAEVSATIDEVVETEAIQDPRGMILAAWLEVEHAINTLVEARELAPNHTRIKQRLLTSIRLIQQKELLDSRYVSLFHELRLLRNEATHSKSFSPPADAVVRYVELARELAAEINRKLPPAQSDA